MTTFEVADIDLDDPTFWPDWFRARSGFTAAGTSWQHQLRGPDGRWIRMFGWVKWLDVDSKKWRTGYVSGIDNDTGTVTINENGHAVEMKRTVAEKRLFGRPKPKGKLDLPNPKTGKTTEGMTQVGGQGGSNPGALFEVDVPSFQAGPDLDKEQATFLLAALGTDEGAWDMPVSVDAPYGTPGDDILLAVPSLDDMGRYDVFYETGGKWYRVPPADEAHRLPDGTLSPEHAVDMSTIYGPPDSEHRKALAELGMPVVMAVRGNETDADKIVGLARSAGSDAPEFGDKFYVKTAASGDAAHKARNEALANMLYEMAGAPVPSVAVGADGTTIASKIIPGAVEFKFTDTAAVKKAQDNFLFDAWLANWDVVGTNSSTGADNMKVDPATGVVYRIDAGGALLYRASNPAPKGAAFGDTVGELKTMRDPQYNANGAKMFGSITDEQLKEQAARLAAITPDEIRDIVAAHGMEDSLADTLIARRKNIFDQLGVPEYAIPVDVPTVTEPVVFNPVEKKMEPGTPPQAAVANYQWQIDNLPSTKISVQDSDLKASDLLIKSDGRIVQYDGGPNMGWEFDGSLKMGVQDAVWVENIGTATFPDGVLDVLVDKDGVPLTVSEGSDLILSLQEFRDLAVAELAAKYTDNPLGPYTDIPPALAPEMDFLTAADATSFLSGQKMAGGPYTPLFRAEQMWGGDKGDVFELVDVSSDIDGQSVAWVRGPDGELTSKSAEELSNEQFFVPNDVQAAMFHAHIAKRNEAWKVEKEQNAGKDMPTPTPPTDGPEVPMPEGPDLESLLTPDPTPDPGLYVEGAIHPGLTPGESINGADFTLDDIDMLNATYTGQAVMLMTETWMDHPEDHKQNTAGLGLWWVESFEAGSSWDFKQTVMVNVINAAGQQRRVRFSKRKSGGGYTDESLPDVFMTPVDASPLAFDDVKVTFKKDWTITFGSVVVGTWNYYGSSAYQYTIAGDYSVTGHPVTAMSKKKTPMKAMVTQHVNPSSIMSGYAPPKPKPKKVTDTEAAIKASPAPSFPNGEIPLNDGTPVEIGKKVVHIKTGDVYTVHSESLAKSEMLMVLKGDVATAGFEDLHILPKNEINSFSVTEVAGDKKVQLDSGEWVGPGGILEMTTTYAGAGTVAYVVDVLPDGETFLMSIKGGGDLFMWHKSAVKPGMTGGQTPVVQKTVDADVAKIVVEPAKTVDAPLPKPQGPVKYPGPGGKTLIQGQAAKQARIDAGLDLTKDGYAPELGMVVRRPDGSQWQIVAFGDPTSATQKNKVRAIPIGVPAETPKLYKVDTLYVDHQAMLTDKNGDDLAVISQFAGMAWDPPDGGKIFHQVKMENKTVDGVTREMPVDYYYLVHSGTVYVLHSGYDLTTVSQKKIKPNDITENPMSDFVGTIDKSAPDGLVLTLQSIAPADSKFQHTVTGLAIHPKVMDGPTIIAQEKAAKAAASAQFSAPTYEGKASELSSPLPHPPITSSAPPVFEPTITTAKGTHFFASEVPGTQSIGAALTQTRDAVKGKKGWNVRKAIADSDYIEDMEVRTSQVQVDGDPMLEVSFRLQADKSVTLRDTLTGSEQEFGGWALANSVTPNQLAVGDKLAVKLGQSSGVLKPAQGVGQILAPNATITSAPELLGVNAAGNDMYRVQVTLTSGHVGWMNLEDRGEPSLRIIEWDPSKIVPKAANGKSLSGTAQSAGWTQVASNVGPESGSHTDSQGFSVDKKTGEAKLKGKQFLNFGSGATYERVMPDGTVIRFASAHDTKNSFDGQVSIRVPVGHPDPELAMARAMEAVGIPPAAQAPPSADSVGRMALNKVQKQFGEMYARTLDTSDLSPQNPTSALAAIDKAVGKKLGRPATMDDISLRIADDGGISVLVSEDVARAIHDTNGASHYYHGYDSGKGGEEFIINAMTGKTSGLLSAKDRNKVGIYTLNVNGSSTTDSTNGGANRVFFRAKTGSKANHRGIIFDPIQVHRQVDYWWVGGKDAWGARNEGGNWGFLYFTNNGKVSVSSQNPDSVTNELLMKRGTDAQAWGRVITNDDKERKKYLDILKAEGVTHAPNGMAIEEFIVTEANVKDLAGSVPHYGDEVNLGALFV